MSILSSLTGGLVDGVASAVDRFVETPDERTAAALKAQALALQPVLAQIQVNEKEAQHASVFVAGWRPGIGWVCGAALAYHFIVQPLLSFAAGVWIQDFEPPPPLSLGELMPILLGLLGLGGMRTAERLQGKDRGAIGKPK